MKKVVLLVCVMVVSGFASSCSYKLTDLNRKIEKYNRECADLHTKKHSILYPGIQRQCQNLEKEVRKAEYELNLCREQRNDDIFRKFNSYR